jgi:hypothetical protein
VLVAPMTTAGRGAPFRIGVSDGGRKEAVALSHLTELSYLRS